MKNDDANPLEPVTDEATEARIVAWVLGEASAFEITELERLCAERPELAVFHRRLLALHGLLGEDRSEATDGEWKLSSERKERVLETIGAAGEVAAGAAKEKRVSSIGLRVMFGIAACLVVTLVVMRLVSPIAQRKYAQASIGEERLVAFAPATGGGSVDELKKMVRDQEDRVEARRKELSQIVRTKGIIYRGEDSFVGEDSEIAAQAHQKLATEKIQLESQIQTLRSYKSDQLMTYASGLDLPENTVRTQYPEYLELRRELDAAKNKGLADNHPDVRKLAERVEDVKKELDEGTENLRATLEAQKRLADARLSKVEVLKGEKRDSSIQRGLDTQDYVDAKKGFETELAKLQEMKQRLTTQSASPASPTAPAATAGPAMADLEDDSSRPARARIITRSDYALSGKAEFKGADQLAKKSDEPLRPEEAARHSANVDEVRRGLYMAEGNFNLGKYDDAKKAYEEVIRKDPYNSAARRGLERVAGAKSDYYRAAYDHTRAELLSQVDSAWELSVPAQGGGQGGGTGSGLAAADPAAMPKKKAVDAPADGFSAAPAADNAPVAGEALMDKMMEEGVVSAKPAPPTADAFAPDPATDVSNIMTGGLRSGDQAITRNNIDAILNNPDRVASQSNVTPGNGEQQVPSFFGDTPLGVESAPVASAPMADPFAAGNESSAKLEARAPTSGLFVTGDSDKESMPLGLVPGMDATYAFKGPKFLEEKPAVEEQNFDEIIAAEEPFSTFSLNVSDVSFQLAKAALERGEQPAPESIKVEQFYNAVDYGDAAPSAGEPVAGVIEQSVHPIVPGRNLVRMGVRTAAAGRSASQPLRLTLLVDQSGSMVREDRKAAMEKAVAGLGQLLTEADRISVIGFSRTSRLIAEDVPGNKISELGALVNPEASEGGTNLEEALRLSEVIANRHKLEGAQNRIVLFTDGAANLGDADPARLAEKVKALRQAGIAFDVAGIGAEDLNDRLLAELARNGNGRYYVAADNLAAQLAGAFRPAAEDVKVQVRFNPQRVAGYRLVGFEESRLKTEDFRNDAIDAAELAAEEAAVALYQVQVLPGGSGEIGEMSVRFREAGTGNTVERSWTIPYDAATPAFDKATPSMKLAGLSMLAAEKLKGGPLADAINFRELAAPLADARRYYKDSSEVSDMARVIGLLAK